LCDADDNKDDTVMIISMIVILDALGAAESERDPGGVSRGVRRTGQGARHYTGSNLLSQKLFHWKTLPEVLYSHSWTKNTG
jgi:hypothetical protein